MQRRIKEVVKLEHQRFGKLKVISKHPSNKYGSTWWLCKCDCGNSKIVTTSHLKTGNTKSCGCLKVPHGMQKTVIYQKWQDILRRCRNKNYKFYKYYGGRGITVCERWFKFKNFYNDMGECPEGLTIERIDNDKGYSPENCKWATMKEQTNNSRRNLFIIYKGQKLTLAQWSEKTGISYTTLKSRIKESDWSIAEALTKTVRKYKRSSIQSCYHYPVSREISDNG